MFNIVELNKESFKKYDKEKYLLEIKPYLPNSILDAHVHIGITDININNITEERKKERFELTISTSLTFEDYFKAFKLLYGGRNFKGLFFAIPLKEINLEKDNEYIGKRIDNCRIFGLITASPNHSKDYFESLIEKYKFIGFKPYPDLANIKDESMIDLDNYVSTNMLEIANKYKLIILIHLKSKSGQEGICCDDYIKKIYEYFEKYPDIKIIIPHMGRAHCPKLAETGIKKVTKIFGTDKIYFDTSTCTQKESFQVFFENYSIDKIIFGNDFPYSLIRGRFYCINDRKRIFVPRENYSWYKGGEEFDRRLSLEAYESLSELFKAFKKIGADKSIFNKIMYKNADDLIKEVLKK